MVQIYVVRHGTTIANSQKVTQGQVDTPLTSAGIKDAQTLGERLKGVVFDAIYSSDLGRAAVTEFIIAKLDDEEDKIHITPQLRELNYGDFNNTPKHAIITACPEYRHNPHFVFPNGESFEQMQDRLEEFILDLDEKYPDGKVLLVTHSGCIRAINSRLMHHFAAAHMSYTISHAYIGKYWISEKKVISYIHSE